MPICILFVCFNYAHYADYIPYFCQVNALLQRLEPQASAGRMGHFALYNCVVLGHTKYKGVQRIYCNPFPAKPFHGCHRPDLVIIRPLGIDNGAFVVKPETVWYALVLLLFSTTVTTDTGSKAFNCALCRHWRHQTILRMVIIAIIGIIPLNDIILLNKK